MRRFFSVLGFALLLGFATTLTVSLPQTAAAAEEEVYRDNADISKMFHKFGRGLVNVLTGWIEIPKNIAKEWRKTDPFTGFVLGTIKGIGWGFGRTVVGVYEVITFPFPIPQDYQPIMSPEFILPSIWGESLPIFQDEFVTESGASSTYTYATGTTYGKQSAIDAANRSYTSP